MNLTKMKDLITGFTNMQLKVYIEELILIFFIQEPQLF
jgi:hypothetical protein